jgi:hypothetical protein
MSPAATYAVITFLVGFILLLGWLYANAANARCGAILGKSVWLFALPIMFLPGAWIALHLGAWAAVACEEGLKAFASTLERSRTNRFWLVALFGIWELTLDKPFWGLVIAHSQESWDRLSMLGFVYVTVLPALMHLVTAAIYAFAFERRLWAAFLASWVVHFAFNESVNHFGPSPAVAIIQTAILTALLTALLFRGRQAVSEIG